MFVVQCMTDDGIFLRSYHFFKRRRPKEGTVICIIDLLKTDCVCRRTSWNEIKLKQKADFLPGIKPTSTLVLFCVRPQFSSPSSPTSIQCDSCMQSLYKHCHTTPIVTPMNPSEPIFQYSLPQSL
jgi:hypothetical protein